MRKTKSAQPSSSFAWPEPSVAATCAPSENVEDARDPSARHPLGVSMIPLGNWGKNVRAVVARDVWDAMRFYLEATKDKPAFMRNLDLPHPNQNTTISCRCCGAQRDSLELHEVWGFDDNEQIQKLLGFIPICDQCHNVFHFGRASQLGLAECTFEHLRIINRLSKAKATKHVEEAYAIWQERSTKSYTVDMAYLRNFLPDTNIHLAWLDTPKHWSGNRLDAIGWARDHFALKDAVIIDTETTGLISGPNKNPNAEVIELAIISLTGRVLYQSRFRPKYKVPKSTTDIHGLIAADLVDCPRFSEEHPKILAVLAGRTVISYNDRFDSGVIAQTCAMFKLGAPDCRWECAMRMYRAFVESARFVKLPGATHGALADCKATLKLMKSMAKG